jgi:hypothetical protein
MQAFSHRMNLENHRKLLAESKRSERAAARRPGGKLAQDVSPVSG